MSSLANFKLPEFMNFGLSSTTQMAIAGIITLIILYLIYYVFFSNSDKDIDFQISAPTDEDYEHEEDLLEGMEDGGEKQAELLFFFADWCPHCKKAKPIVDEIKNKYDKRTINFHTINVTYVDCTNETQESKRLLEQYEVEGFPTIFLKIGKNVTKYEESPSKDELSKFIEKIIKG